MTETERQLLAMHTEYNQATADSFMAQEIRASFENWELIMEAIATGRALDVSKAPQVRNRPALVIGSGPSLDRALPLLHEWKGDVFCSTSQAATLVYHGKEPTYVVALDPNCDITHMDADTWEGRQTILITQPGVRPSLIQGWKGLMCLFRCESIRARQYSKIQAIGYSEHVGGTSYRMHIPTEVRSFGSVVPAACHFAMVLGYRPIFLVGTDFGYPGGRRRFSRWGWAQGGWLAYPEPEIMEEALESDTGCPSDLQQLFYRENCINSWRLDPSNIINTAVDGTLGPDTFPQADIEEVIGRQGKHFRGYHQKRVKEVADLWMARHNLYMIECADPRFIKTNDPVAAVRQHCADLRRRKIAVDEAANLRRIEKLMEAVKDE